MKAAQCFRMSKPIPTLQKFMTTSPHSIGKEQTLERAHEMMRTHRIRHLPVMQDDKIVGVVSIGDLVKWIISEQAQTIQSLENYISGKYPS